MSYKYNKTQLSDGKLFPILVLNIGSSYERLENLKKKYNVTKPVAFVLTFITYNMYRVGLLKYVHWLVSRYFLHSIPVMIGFFKYPPDAPMWSKVVPYVYLLYCNDYILRACLLWKTSSLRKVQIFFFYIYNSSFWWTM